MIGDQMEKETIVQNLKDAGCSDDFVERFLRSMEQGARRNSCGCSPVKDAGFWSCSTMIRES